MKNDGVPPMAARDWFIIVCTQNSGNILMGTIPQAALRPAPLKGEPSAIFKVLLAPIEGWFRCHESIAKRRNPFVGADARHRPAGRDGRRKIEASK